MIYVDRLEANLPAFPCEQVAGESAGTIGLKLPDGKFLGLNLKTGQWTSNDKIGAWESFKKGKNALVMDVTWDGVRYTWIRPFVEV